MEGMSPIKKLFVGLLLVLVSVVLKYLVTALAMVVSPIYYIITFKWKSGIGALGDWLFKVALANDQSGNVIGKVIFQFLFTKPGGHLYGCEDDTVSYVLARNKYKGKLSGPGVVLARILESIDSGHLYKAIESKIESDQDALLRIQEDKYFE
jgi:hypothetical protein